MVAPMLALGVAAGALAKGFASIWFSSRATSPLSEPWRREFLEHSELGINKLEQLKLAPPEWITALRADMTLLQKHVHDGWNRKEVFDAACRVAAYLGWKHTTTGMTGIAGLAGTYADHHVLQPLEKAFEDLNRASERIIEGVFGKKPDDKDPPHDATH